MKTLNDVLKNAGNEMHAVVPFDRSVDQLILMDFTAANEALSDEVINDISLFSSYVDRHLAAAGARYGIGGYGEHRTLYSRSEVFNSHDTEEPRRFHLGLDIWGKAGTPIFAALDGLVHSFAFNDHYGDYGATIILQHQLDGHVFYTLYGHLSLIDLELKTGQLIRKGAQFAHFGIPEENGHWPPHLHIQVIEDLHGARGDYPGVCQFSEREKWLANCPNPDLICHLNRFVSNNNLNHL